ncbi:MAG: hypothetical protein KF784_07660 [Fimbriimonadaceae bacterium]|nr:hypothetical protein [Fimbriimonadaceae bacterium]
MPKKPFEEALKAHYRSIEDAPVPSMTLPETKRRTSLWLSIAGPALAGWAAALLLAYFGSAAPATREPSGNPILSHQMAQLRIDEPAKLGGRS